MTNLSATLSQDAKSLIKSNAVRWHRACSLGFPQTSESTREKGNENGAIQQKNKSLGSVRFGAVRLADRSIYGVERVRCVERFRGHLQHLF